MFVYAINFKSVLTFNYFFNQTEITELFCINKEKPKLECNGKCHLATQINQVEDTNDEIPFSQQTVNYNLEIYPIVVDVDFDAEATSTELQKNQSIFITRSLSKGYHSILSPPPKV